MCLLHEEKFNASIAIRHKGKNNNFIFYYFVFVISKWYRSLFFFVLYHVLDFNLNESLKIRKPINVNNALSIETIYRESSKSNGILICFR